MLKSTKIILTDFNFFRFVPPPSSFALAPPLQDRFGQDQDLKKWS